MKMKVFENGNEILLLTKYNTYFYYDNENMPRTTYTPSEDCYFTVTTNGKIYTVTDKKNRKLCIDSSNDTEIYFIEHDNSLENGFSLKGVKSGKYFGVSSKGKVLVYPDSDSWDTRWFPYCVSGYENNDFNQNNNSFTESYNDCFIDNSYKKYEKNENNFGNYENFSENNYNEKKYFNDDNKGGNNYTEKKYFYDDNKGGNNYNQNTFVVNNEKKYFYDENKGGNNYNEKKYVYGQNYSDNNEKKYAYDENKGGNNFNEKKYIYDENKGGNNYNEKKYAYDDNKGGNNFNEKKYIYDDNKEGNNYEYLTSQYNDDIKKFY
jgi:hypothetical protein